MFSAVDSKVKLVKKLWLLGELTISSPTCISLRTETDCNNTLPRVLTLWRGFIIISDFGNSTGEIVQHLPARVSSALHLLTLRRSSRRAKSVICLLDWTKLRCFLGDESSSPHGQFLHQLQDHCFLWHSGPLYWPKPNLSIRHILPQFHQTYTTASQPVSWIKARTPLQTMPCSCY